jgi:hypothetical protein
LGGVSYGAQSDQRRILQALTQSISNLDAAATNVLIDMRKALDADLDETAADLRREAAYSDDELRQHLHYVLAGSIRNRVWGAVLLALGIALATAGSVVGNL